MINPYIAVRSADTTDAAALAQVHRQSWELAYRGIIPEPQLRITMSNHDASWWQRRLRGAASSVLVLTAGDAVAGYCTLGRARAGSPVQGEIYELYIEPAHQGIGLGTELFEAARAHLDRTDLNGLIVWVLTANEQAIGFYQGRGGEIVGTAHERFGAVQLHKTAFLWR